MTITEFLEARIAEDEAEADYLLGREDNEANAYGKHFLAECAAKRAIIGLADQVETAEDQMAREWGTPEVIADGILSALASVYKDHPDYDPRWSL